MTMTTVPRRRVPFALAVLAAAAGTFAAASARAEAVTFGFDDLCDTCFIDNGYRGYTQLGWENWGALDVVGGQVSGSPSGYLNGVVSPRNVAYNYFGNWNNLRSTTAFSLVSATMTAAYKDGLTARIVGWYQGSKVYEDTFDLLTTERRFIEFDPAKVDFVEFRNDFNGVDNPFYGGGGFQWALDDLTLNLAAVPEPSSWALLAGGLALLGAHGRRRARRPG